VKHDKEIAKMEGIMTNQQNRFNSILQQVDEEHDNGKVEEKNLHCNFFT